MDEQRQPDLDPEGRRGVRGAEERADMDVQGRKGMAASDTDGEPDVVGHIQRDPAISRDAQGYRKSA